MYSIISCVKKVKVVSYFCHEEKSVYKTKNKGKL